MAEFIRPEVIIAQYGLRFNSDFSCQANALLNALRIAMMEPEESSFPRIYQMPMSRKPTDVHAYLIWRNSVLNGGVTANYQEYPDFNLEEIYFKGKDFTKEILSIAMVAFLGNKAHLKKANSLGNSLRHFRLAIEETFSGLQYNDSVGALIWGYKQVAG